MVFTLLLIVTIPVLAVSQINHFHIKLKANNIPYKNPLIQVRAYILGALPCDYRILWNAGILNVFFFLVLS